MTLVSYNNTSHLLSLPHMNMNMNMNFGALAEGPVLI